MTSTKITALAALLFAVASPAAFAAPTHEEVSTRGRDAPLRFEWELTAVQIDGLADEQVERRVNEALRARARAERVEMATNLKDLDSTSELESSLGVHMTVNRLDDQFLSLTVSVETMYSGAAHPNHQLRGLTFDLRSGDEVTSAQVLPKDEATRARLAALLDAHLRADPGNYRAPDEYRFDTVEPSDVTDVVFEADGSVTFLFGDYQLGGYAAGLTSLSLPPYELAGLLEPNAPVSATVGLAGALPGR